jgi:hypothetical protein
LALLALAAFAVSVIGFVPILILNPRLVFGVTGTHRDHTQCPPPPGLGVTETGKPYPPYPPVIRKP